MQTIAQIRFYVLCILLTSAAVTCAGTGNLFRITESGPALEQPLHFTLCLNVSEARPLSCQKYHTQSSSMIINTTTPNQNYLFAGLKLDTPGYTYNPLGNEPVTSPSQYTYPGKISTTQSSQGIVIKNNGYTVGGTVSGLVGTVVLQNNGQDNLPISTNGSFTFSSSIDQGKPYSVTVLTQPANQSCSVINGSGIINQANVTNVSVTCTYLPTTLSVSSNGIIPVNSGSGSITVTNTGTLYPAQNVMASLPDGWTAVTQNANDCVSIAPNGGSCTLLFTSTAPYVAQNNIFITGDNITSPPTTALAFSISGYLVFSVDSTNSASVIDTSDLSAQMWGELGQTFAYYYVDGFANTAQIVHSGIVSSGAALSCYYSTAGGATVGTWYLPAICQMGNSMPGVGCNPTPNLDTNLFRLGFGGISGHYWSSTEESSFPSIGAWTQFYIANGGSYQQAYNKQDFTLNVRCARSINY